MNHGDGDRRVHHTYKKGDHNVSVYPDKNKWMKWDASKSGSGQRYSGNRPEELDKYLKGHAKRNKGSGGAENPDAYFKQHGKCPPGYRHDGNKCVKEQGESYGRAARLLGVSEKIVPKPGTPDAHQHRIALDTMRNPAKGLMGGPTAQEAEQMLRSKFKYSEEEIKKLKNESVTEDLTAHDLTKPLTADASLTFDPYPWMDNGNMKLTKGQIPVHELEKYLTRIGKEPVKLTPTNDRKGKSFIFKAEHGHETDDVEVTIKLKAGEAHEAADNVVVLSRKDHDKTIPWSTATQALAKKAKRADSLAGFTYTFPDAETAKQFKQAIGSESVVREAGQKEVEGLDKDMKAAFTVVADTAEPNMVSFLVDLEGADMNQQRAQLRTMGQHHSMPFIRIVKNNQPHFGGKSFNPGKGQDLYIVQFQYTPSESCGRAGKLLAKYGEAEQTKDDLQQALKGDEDQLKKYKDDLAKLQRGEKVQNLTVDGAKKSIASLEQVIANKKKKLASM